MQRAAWLDLVHALARDRRGPLDDPVQSKIRRNPARSGSALSGQRHVITLSVATSEDRRGAKSYYEQALEAAAKIRFRPELALTHARLAALLLKDGGRSEAMAHLRIALPELQEMKMLPYLERALAGYDRSMDQ